MRGLLAAAAGCVTFAVLGLGSAGATFPGANGQIAFESSRSLGIAVVGPGGGAVKSLPASTRQSGPSYSRDGRLLAYSEARDIYVRTLATGAVRQVTKAGATDQNPAFGPDGRIAFRRASVGDIFVVNLDGTGLRNVTNDPGGSEYDPAWSPDGRRIAYTRSGCAPPGNEGGVCVWVVNADGSGKTLLTPEETLSECPDLQYGHRRHSEQPSWSPDGSKIAYAGPFDNCAGPGGGGDIWVMNPDGSGKQNVLKDAGTGSRDVQPVWSPDGTRIAFVSDRERKDTNTEIWTVAAGGGGLTRITNDGEQDADPDWAVRVVVRPCGNVVRGSGRSETLKGSAEGDRLLGLGGNDVLNGLGGDDCLDGGAGNDALNGGPGNDRLVGGAGANRYSAGAGNDTINAANRVRETIDCGAGRDTATVDRTDRVRGCEKLVRR